MSGICNQSGECGMQATEFSIKVKAEMSGSETGEMRRNAWHELSEIKEYQGDSKTDKLVETALFNTTTKLDGQLPSPGSCAISEYISSSHHISSLPRLFE
ncbi:MAG: hypothetical protein M1825_002158 [Sarcosagium campestre]|nr:MAG: hypothetical protein M1825_002158 [Sarcosagium campestre]